MNLLQTLKIALNALWIHKTRSALTILGIVIGITSIILVVSVGRGAEGIIIGELGGLGAETLVIRPGKQPSGLTDFADIFFADSLKEKELIALQKKQNVPDLIFISPQVIVPGSITYEGDSFKPLILGFSAEFMGESFDLRLKSGRIFDNIEIRNKLSVAVIGSRVEKELFGNESAVGKNVQVKGRKFNVIGVYEERGQVAFFNIDELVLIPHSTAQTYLTGVSHYSQIVVRVSSPDLVSRTVVDIERTLREMHNIEDPEKDDFHVETQQGLVEQIQIILGIFTLFLALVVAISLVVGGVGVMNIMLVSVTERTKEIGLRKAVGATNANILTQFLIESIILTAIGGVIGVIAGAVLALSISIVVTLYGPFNLPFIFPFGAALLGIIASALVGVIFGLYPARQAAKKSPIEALRYE